MIISWQAAQCMASTKNAKLKDMGNHSHLDEFLGSEVSMSFFLPVWGLFVQCPKVDEASIITWRQSGDHDGRSGKIHAHLKFRTSQCHANKKVQYLVHPLCDSCVLHSVCSSNSTRSVLQPPSHSQWLLRLSFVEVPVPACLEESRSVMCGALSHHVGRTSAEPASPSDLGSSSSAQQAHSSLGLTALTGKTSVGQLLLRWYRAKAMHASNLFLQSSDPVLRCRKLKRPRASSKTLVGLAKKFIKHSSHADRVNTAIYGEFATLLRFL